MIIKLLNFFTDPFSEIEKKETFVVVNFELFVAHKRSFHCHVFDEWLGITAESVEIQCLIWNEQIDSQEFTFDV